MGRKAGFTLIELSIVLVIIGLIVGGVLVGQDLIKAAEVRAQISQIETYNQAVNTFRAKFNATPGDMDIGTANQFGFTAGSGCTGSLGKRDGNGLIQQGNLPSWPYMQIGEPGLFWADLSSSAAGNLIEGQFSNSGAAAPGCVDYAATLSTTPGTTYIGDYFPEAKIGHGNFVYVWDPNGANWYGIIGITSVATSGQIQTTTQSIPVIQAYNIDKKVDDSLPTTGSIQAIYPSNGQSIANSANAASDTTTSCYNSTSGVYSISSYANYGAGGHCALSFRFQ